MADYLKDINTIGAWSTYSIPTSRVLDSVTTPDPDPEDGDELFGNEGDEAPIPEDPTEEVIQEIPRLLYSNRNPRRPCPDCQPYIGTIWQLGCQPRVPRHQGCMCYYQEIYLFETKNRNRFPKEPENQANQDPKLV